MVALRAKFRLTPFRDVGRIMFMQPHEFEDAKLLWKMFYAEQCFKHAQAAAEHILKEKLEEPSPLFYPLITAVYVLYGKPFRVSRGVGKLGEEMIPSEHLELHRLLLNHRDQIYAHSDAMSFELPDCGQPNQVGVLRGPTEMRLFGIQFHARYPLMPSVIDLCRSLQKKTGSNVTTLFERYATLVPNRVGEYSINIYDPAGGFFVEKGK